jgi:hypothetical protein
LIGASLIYITFVMYHEIAAKLAAAGRFGFGKRAQFAKFENNSFRDDGSGSPASPTGASSPSNFGMGGTITLGKSGGNRGVSTKWQSDEGPKSPRTITIGASPATPKSQYIGSMLKGSSRKLETEAVELTSIDRSSKKITSTETSGIDMDMSMNPLYSLTGLGDEYSTIDDVKKRQEEAKMKERAILEDNARMKREMQNKERQNNEMKEKKVVKKTEMGGTLL